MTHTTDIADVNIPATQAALRSEGYHRLDGVYDRATCQRMIDEMNAWQQGRQEKNYGGTELRIWDAQSISPLFDDFFQMSNRLMSAFRGREETAYTLLAIRNQPLPEADTTLRAGRWHLDSLRHQLKVFLFLSDTTINTGPFEFLQGTHRTSFKLSMLATGQLLTPRDLLSGKRSYNSIPDETIARLAAQGYEQTPVLCEAGTVLLMDTSAVHRARPCVDGTRYALTAYFR